MVPSRGRPFFLRNVVDNRVVISLLTSRVGRRLGRRLAVVEYLGRRTGRRHRLVTPYVTDGRREASVAQLGNEVGALRIAVPARGDRSRRLAPITAVVPVSTTGGNVTVAFAVLPYAGNLVVTVVADPQRCPDAARLVVALQHELDVSTPPVP